MCVIVGATWPPVTVCVHLRSSVERESVLCSVVSKHKRVDGETLRMRRTRPLFRPMTWPLLRPGLYLSPASIQTNTVIGLGLGSVSHSQQHIVSYS